MMETSFTLSASDWSDDAEDFPLSYYYLYTDPTATDEVRVRARVRVRVRVQVYICGLSVWLALGPFGVHRGPAVVPLFIRG